MINENFIFLGAILSFLGSLTYVIDTIKGKVKVNRVTWFLWALAPLIAFIAEIKQGIGLQALMTFMVGFNPLCVFFASFVNKKSEWKLGRLDFICGFISLIGIFLWYITKTGNTAILFSILADFLAGIPIIVKSFRLPETESYFIFLLGAINALITILTIKKWSFEYYAFPLYVFFMCILIVILVKFKAGKKIKIKFYK